MSLRRFVPRSLRHWGALCLAVLIVAVVVVVAWPGSGPTPVHAEDERITVPGGPGVDHDVILDAGLYLPARTPAPAVIVAHGFGGSRASVDADAQRLVRAGFVVLTYSARGFGMSTGRVGLDSLDYEVPDARHLVDWLGQRPEVIQDDLGDPRVGVTGGSYGGALALMLAGTDPRVDAVAAIATWNDLEQALFPNNAVPAGMTTSAGPAPPATPAAIPAGPDGVFKQAWAALLMSSVLSGTALEPGAVAGDSDTPSNAVPTGCGRLMPQVCSAYAQVAEAGRLTPAMTELLDNSSPKRVVDNITAPTLLVQGEDDTLFGLDQADANARAIAAQGTPVAVSWFPGGHSGGGLDRANQDRITGWFEHYLAGIGPAPSQAFRYSVPGPVNDRGGSRHRTLEAPGYPGLHHGSATPLAAIELSGPAQQILNPPGGQPAAISSLPGLARIGSGALGMLATPPGQTARFVSAPVATTTVLTGSPTATLSIARVATGFGAAEPVTPPPESGVLYASLATVPASAAGEADGSPTAISALGTADAPAGGAVAPIRLPHLPADGTPVEVAVHLPAVALHIPAGEAVELRIGTTDQAYAGAAAAAVYRVALADGHVLHLPEVDGTPIAGSAVSLGWWVAVAVVAALAIAGLVVAGGRRHGSAAGEPDSGTEADSPHGAPVPLVVDGLRKVYPGGVVAVDDVGFTVERGQVLGLLGPNGAGKTTTLRMAMGLITPSGGTVRVFGTEVSPGAPVLSRIGCFVEGSGFLPHLSGRANLELYWRATGRPASSARLADALQIAGLGTAIRRKVKTYSQGMRQRLAIAQAMLGLPDLLILDEPTNGLDPPQIHAMREVLRRYAETGRTVLISSHLLSEVEQTCSHVVIIAGGRTVAAGTVTDMMAASGEMFIATPDPAAASAHLRTLPGLAAMEATVDGVRVDLGEVTLGQVLQPLLDAGIAVTSAAPRNRLEDVFLELVGAGTVGAGADGATEAAPRSPVVSHDAGPRHHDPDSAGPSQRGDDR